MKALYFSLSLLLCCVLFGAGSGCAVSFPDELPYTCETDADCGGKGYVCTSLPDSRRYCCLPETETCNHLDDDCNGVVDDLNADPCYAGPEATRNVGACRAGKPACAADGTIRCEGEVLPTAEVCNGKDDNCDGTVDEGFDFQTGRNNCGRCDQACTALEDCVAGQCTKRKEIICDDGLDNDGDGSTDCADSDCNTLPSGPGSTCIGGKKAETDCNNGVDDDGDGPMDCADPDCDSRSCGPGCICINGVRGEGDCNNGVDDDGDGSAKIDCADPDCTDKACGDGCVCQNGVKTEILCDDFVLNPDGTPSATQWDNDGDTKANCADTDCNNKVCGVGCLCATPNKKEVVCSDGLDNDGDTKADCADTDCNTQICSPGGDTGATCKASLCAEIHCNDGLDNDKDGKADCLDSDCNGQTCGLGGSACNFGSGACVETTCNDGQDNDNDNKKDCLDPDCEGVSVATGKVCTVANGQQEGGPAGAKDACSDGVDNDGDGLIDCNNGKPEPNCLTGICGVGCQYNNTVGSACNVKVETLCNDNVDNDKDTKVDCADTDCLNKACTKSGGGAGTCNASGQCI
ncbi:MAG: hypothetical protein ACJ8AT_16010 [Hyalangium sp.]|uniref:hypothetical protein n=1 Tax=Hyalangium sp. TaxID=2028555 RepID=UPI003899BC6B